MDKSVERDLDNILVGATINRSNKKLLVTDNRLVPTAFKKLSLFDNVNS